MNEPRKNPALNRALNLLSKRSYSEKRLREKIAEKGFNTDEIDQAVTRLKELKFIDDRRFGENLSREMAEFRHFGPRRIYLELIKKGLEKNLAKDVVDRIVQDFDQSIDEILKKYLKKCSNVATDKLYNRALGFLIRRGFSYESSRDKVKNELKKR